MQFPIYLELVTEEVTLEFLGDPLVPEPASKEKIGRKKMSKGEERNRIVTLYIVIVNSTQVSNSNLRIAKGKRMKPIKEAENTASRRKEHHPFPHLLHPQGKKIQPIQS